MWFNQPFLMRTLKQGYVMNFSGKISRAKEPLLQNPTYEFIKEGKLKHLTLTDVKEIFDKNTDQDLEHSSKILDIRERMQYSVKTSLAEEEFQLLKKRTKALFDKIRLDLEEE